MTRLGGDGGVRVGYARVSPYFSDHLHQVEALTAAGCGRLVVETAGLRDPRPLLTTTLQRLGAGDALVVCTPDRIAVSIKDLLHLVHHRLGPREAGLRILAGSCAGVHEPGGVLFCAAAMAAEMEQGLAAERGRERAARDGTAGGAGRGGLSDADLAAARVRVQRGEGIPAIARDLKVGRSTLYRALLEQSLQPPAEGD